MSAGAGRRSGAAVRCFSIGGERTGSSVGARLSRRRSSFLIASSMMARASSTLRVGVVVEAYRSLLRRARAVMPWSRAKATCVMSDALNFATSAVRSAAVRKLRFVVMPQRLRRLRELRGG